jgi:hypothetical protein
MNNFPGIPNATVYSCYNGAPKTQLQQPITATIYGHSSGAPKTPPQQPINATIYGHAKLYKKG